MRICTLHALGIFILAGAALLALPRSSAVAQQEAEPLSVVVEFRGMNTSENLLRLMTGLRERFGESLIGTKSVKVVEGDSVCKVLSEAFALVGCPGEAAMALAEEFNSDGTFLKSGDSILLPDVATEDFFYTVRIDDSKFSVSQGHSNILQDPSWNSVIVSREYFPQQYGEVVQLVGKRMRLHPQLSVAIPNILQAIADLEIDDTTAYVAGGRASGRQLFSHASVAEKAAECRDAANGPPPIPSMPEGGYWTMLESLSDWELPSCALTCADRAADDIKCPQIVLIDAPVHPHPDLAAATAWLDTSNAPQSYANGACSGAAGDGAENCSFIDFERQCHHGTSMASVLVDQPNELGFLGMAPAARLLSLNWLEADFASIPNFLQARFDEANFHQNGPQLYVFASKFPDPSLGNGQVIDDASVSYPAQALANDNRMRLKSEEMLLSPPIIKKIQETKELWITAAGQPSPGKPPVEISSLSAIAPMNLGSLPNVIVVTACDPCEGPDRTLWKEANFSSERGLINLAAPGLEYVTAANLGAYANEHGGTSQATAFVAGLSAAMVSCDASEFGADGEHAYLDSSSHQVVAHRLKRRLILTSTPIEKPATNGAVVSGIVNPALALKNPNKSWFLPRNANSNEDYKEISAQWCTQADLTFYPLDALGNRQPPISITRKNTRRIRAEGDGDQRRWFIYSVLPDPSDPNVIIYGPVVLRSAEQNLIQAGDVTFKPNDLDDLVLANDVAWATSADCPSEVADLQ